MSEIKNLKKGRERPLSPHLGHYKLPITALTSITHRITGVFLLLGCFFFVYWLIAVSKGPDAYENFKSVRENSIISILIWGWISALSYHFLNGLRHFIWDTGFGLSLEAARNSSIFIVVATLSAAAFFAMQIFGLSV